MQKYIFFVRDSMQLPAMMYVVVALAILNLGLLYLVLAARREVMALRREVDSWDAWLRELWNSRPGLNRFLGSCSFPEK